MADVLDFRLARIRKLSRDLVTELGVEDQVEDPLDFVRAIERELTSIELSSPTGGIVKDYRELFLLLAEAG